MEKSCCFLFDNFKKLGISLAAFSAILFAAEQAKGTPETNMLVNVQIVDGGLEKCGAEIVGSSGDYWNSNGCPLYSGDVPAESDDPFFGAAILWNSASEPTEMSIYAYSAYDQVYVNEPDTSSTDPLFQSVGQTAGGGDWQLEIDNLAYSGTWYIYVYASPVLDYPDGAFVSFDVDSLAGTGTGSTSVIAGEYYSILEVDEVVAGSNIVINISSDYEPVCNGLQIWFHNP